MLAEGGLDGEPRSAVECDNKLHQRSNEVEEGKCDEVVEAVQRQSRQADEAATISPESTATRTSDTVAIYAQRRSRLNTNAVVTLRPLQRKSQTLSDQVAKKAAGVRKQLPKRQCRCRRSATKSLSPTTRRTNDKVATDAQRQGR